MQVTIKTAASLVACALLFSGCVTQNPNRPPAIRSFDPDGDFVLAEGASRTLSLNASDQDGQKLTCVWFVDGQKVLSQKPPFVYLWNAGQKTGQRQINAVVSDGSLTAIRVWNVTVFPQNRPPVISDIVPGPNPTVNEGATLEFWARSSDPEGATVTVVWYLDNTSVQSNGTRYLYTPDFRNAGSHTLIYSVSDGKASSQHRWNITVMDVNRPPNFTNWSPQGDVVLREMETETFCATAQDEDGGSISYRWALDGNPAGTGQTFSFYPDYLSCGNHTVDVFASDGMLELGRSWKVTVENVNRPPQIAYHSPQGLVSLSEYETQSFFIDCSDPDGEVADVTWFVNDAGFPAGTGGRFNFTGGYDSVGTHTVSAIVSDGIVTVSRNWTVTVSRARTNWTVLAYLNGDNDLEPYLIDDLNEMEMAGSNNGVSMVAQFDRSPNYDASNGDWSNTRRFRIEKDNDSRRIGSRLLQTLGELDMANGQSLSDFLCWGLEYFPADNYHLIMGGHGDGWMGMMQDFTNDHHKMPLAEVALAISNFSRVRNGAPLEVVEFDVCYWALLEVGYDVGKNAQYIIASEDIDPSPGQSYNLYLGNLTNDPSISPLELAKTSVRYFGQSYSDGKFPPEDNDTYTKSAIDCARLPQLMANLNGLSAILAANVTSFGPAISAARAAVEFYGKPDYVDLYHFCQLLRINSPDGALNASIDGVLELVNSSVVANACGIYRPNSHGIAIYFPQFSYLYSFAYSTLNFSASGLWDDFLRAYHNISGRGISCENVDLSIFPGGQLLSVEARIYDRKILNLVATYIPLQGKEEQS